MKYSIAIYYRTKVDLNRDIIEGAQGNPVAVAAYKCYHDCITRAKYSANRGILFDLHGQVRKYKMHLNNLFALKFVWF